MRHAVKAPVLPFEHRGDGGGHVAAHAAGEALLDGFQVRGHKDADCVFRKQLQMLRFGDDIEDMLVRRGLLQFLSEEVLREGLAFGEAQIVLACEDLRLKRPL